MAPQRIGAPLSSAVWIGFVWEDGDTSRSLVCSLYGPRSEPLKQRSATVERSPERPEARLRVVMTRTISSSVPTAVVPARHALLFILLARPSKQPAHSSSPLAGRWPSRLLSVGRLDAVQPRRRSAFGSLVVGSPCWAACPHRWPATRAAGGERSVAASKRRAGVAASNILGGHWGACSLSGNCADPPSDWPLVAPFTPTRQTARPFDP